MSYYFGANSQQIAYTKIVVHIEPSLQKTIAALKHPPKKTRDFSNV